MVGLYKAYLGTPLEKSVYSEKMLLKSAELIRQWLLLTATNVEDLRPKFLEKR